MDELISFLQKEIQFLPGVGPGLATRFRALAIKTVWDLLSHLPVGLETFPVRPVSASLGKKVSAAVTVLSRNKMHGRRTQMCVRCRTLPFESCPGGESLDILFFNTASWSWGLHPGTSWILKGSLSDHLPCTMIHPEDVVPLREVSRWSPYTPKYALTKGLSLKMFLRVLAQAKAELSPFPEWIPDTVLEQFGWPPLHEALLRSHDPKSEEDLLPSCPWRERLAFDELLAQQIFFLQERTLLKTLHAQKAFSPPGPMVEHILSGFGHPLTEGQQKAWEHISSDLQGNAPMMRLVHGDVGSGKTILGFLALMHGVESGTQGALLAPTEILARQHMVTFRKILGRLGVSARLFLGGRKKAEDHFIPEDIVIGTHALFQERVRFWNLGIVVVDEQHRFGVEQRLHLMKKGILPHALFFSATPIPRTFEMCLFGDLEVSRLSERPQPFRAKTYIMSSASIEKLVLWIEERLSHEERAYWVCPLIEDDDAQESDSTQSVKKRAEFLAMRFPDRVSMLHGKMSPQQKQDEMDRFRSGKTLLLVATTVIEVGVHVPEATIMVIEASERFGLAQLHQLRGRIGRDGREGYCFLLYTDPISKVSRTRLQILRSHSDGFEIAEKDWQLRGGGDRSGILQSGEFSYTFADPYVHRLFIPLALETAQLSTLRAKDLLLSLFPWHRTGITYAG